MAELWWANIYDGVIEPVEVRFRQDGTIEDIRALGLGGRFELATDQLIEPLSDRPRLTVHTLMEGLIPKKEPLPEDIELLPFRPAKAVRDLFSEPPF